MSRHITAVPLSAAGPLAVLHRACFPEEPWDASAIERILALPGGFGHLAWEEDNPAGFVLARDLGGEVEILSLGVVPERRRHGVGRALLDAVIDEAGRRCTSSVVLEVAAGNATARRLYAAAGFRCVGCRPRYYGDTGDHADALILRLIIASGPSAA
ncbi:MAG TPA: GNAT family N-acetyltransferase [Stellaceae bacterium]|nr:GNAT family N-acetyltransferase [Stellaceae bacterium]